MKYFKFLLVLTAIALAGCGSRVNVDPANVGKILTKNGYSPEIIPPSKFRLPACVSYCDKLITLSVSDNILNQTMEVWMPKDELNITADIRGTYSIPSDESTINVLFNRLEAREINDSLSVISAQHVFSTYGLQAVRGIVRSEITKYTIQEVLANREAIGQNIHKAVIEKLKATNTPLEISRFELADVQPPGVIVKAKEKAKEREIAIQQAEADAQVAMVEAEKALEIAKKDRLVDREKAEAMAEQNRIAAKSITPQVLAYKQLETLIEVTRLAASNGNTVFLPMAMDSHSMSELVSDKALAKFLGAELK